MLLTRLITALILIPLFLAAIIYLPPLYISLIAAVLMLIAAWEWAGLIGFQKKIFKVMYVVLVAIALCFSFYFSTVSLLLIILFTALVIWLWVFAGIIAYQRGKAGAGFQCPWMRGLMGLIVCVSTWSAIDSMAANPFNGPYWLIFLLLIVWAADVGGYFAGRFFGKHALCSRVSPKKTWEGFFGGLVLSMIVAASAGLFFPLSLSHYFYLLLIAFICALFSVVGDLGVSLLKRISGVKDSGKIVPGHGGLLDRMDSVAAAIVVFELLLFYLL